MLLEKWFRKNLKYFLLIYKDTLSISKIHAVLITSGSFRNGISTAQLIASYARTGNIDLARKLFDNLPKRGIDSWNALLIGLSRGNDPVEVINLYKRMSSEGIKLDSSTFTVAIKACTSTLDLKSGEEIWENAKEFGYGDDIFVGSSILNLYTKCGKMEEAMNVFDRMSRRDVVSWSTMITGFVKCGRIVEAIDLYRWMQREGFEGDGVVMLALIQACANFEDSQMASSLHAYIVRRSCFRMDVVVQTSLIDMYAKNGKLEIASTIFRTMRYRNVVSWSSLISGYAKNGYAGKALELLTEMKSHGFEPDLVALVSALLACSQAGFSILGREIHGYIVRRLELDQVLGTALVDMYAKCGSLTRARLLYERMMGCGDVILWNTIISSYGIHGEGEKALNIFHRMIESQIRPDHATFASLLSALSHSGLVEQGQYWFNSMIKDYKIQPMEKHYVSLIDLLARGGRVEEAGSMIQAMKFEPGVAVWVALLSGCVNHKKLLIGEMVAKKVLELNPESPGVYALVSNFFASAKKWDEVAMVRKAMKTAETKKVPGYSVVEVNGRLHSFLADDKNHPQYEQMVLVLEEMEREMRAMGYVPKTEFVLHNVEEEVKARMLLKHSERLAIAFGVMNSGPGTRLVVTKNLRVCGDCHDAIKFMSVVTRREIVVRDVKRFHHFKNGACSCGDYW
ncbi:hypothetical protein ACS0TY_025926 [Phlomoides rotata]